MAENPYVYKEKEKTQVKVDASGMAMQTDSDTAINTVKTVSGTVIGVAAITGATLVMCKKHVASWIRAFKGGWW